MLMSLSTVSTTRRCIARETFCEFVRVINVTIIIIIYLFKCTINSNADVRMDVLLPSVARQDGGSVAEVRRPLTRSSPRPSH